MHPRSLRARLTLGYALGLTLALICFALASLWLLDRLQRATLDQQLTAARDGAASIIDERRNRVEVDEGDHRQFGEIIGGRFDGAVIGLHGATVLQSGAALPEAIRHTALSRPNVSLETLANGGEPVRAAWRAVPLGGGPPLGVLVVWKPTGGIVLLERDALAAYAIAIPLVVVIAIGLGAAIAQRGLEPLDDIAGQTS